MFLKFSNKLDEKELDVKIEEAKFQRKKEITNSNIKYFIGILTAFFSLGYFVPIKEIINSGLSELISWFSSVVEPCFPDLVHLVMLLIFSVVLMWAIVGIVIKIVFRVIDNFLESKRQVFDEHIEKLEEIKQR